MSVQWQYSTAINKNPGKNVDIDNASVEELNLGSYARKQVSNLDNIGDPLARKHFDRGLLHFFGYQHEESAKCFNLCLSIAPACVLAHGMIALCHSPNYNFNSDTYYNSTNHGVSDEVDAFPSQQVAHKHAKLAMEKIESLKLKRNNSKRKSNQKRRNSDNSSSGLALSEKEYGLLSAIHILHSHPGIQPNQAEEKVGRPFVNALKRLYSRFEHDADIIYFYAESLMVLNAWNLYEYPNGTPKTTDVLEIQRLLEVGLENHPTHPGLCHMYLHLSEMSPRPEVALDACMVLRTDFPDLGHLRHMATHIDVLVGDYSSCIKYNSLAIAADEKLMARCSDTAGPLSFYFGYFAHNYHMLVYGAILGGMEQIGMEFATKLNTILAESLFEEEPELTVYLESYSALDIHLLVRFGRWEEILKLDFPSNLKLMFFRTASLYFARALAFTQSGDLQEAKKEADTLDEFCNDSIACEHILHNNPISSLLAIDQVMLRGELAYREGSYDDSFKLLRCAVEMQDSLCYDEPWGKMQPVRHALGGLLLEQEKVEEANQVFRDDLKLHPKNPWSLHGLIQCLEFESNSPSCCAINGKGGNLHQNEELKTLKAQFYEQRKSEWADFNIASSCLCCQPKEINFDN